MKPSGMDDAEPELTEAERRAIAEIRRKLDEEFRRKLDAQYGPLEDPDHVHAASPGELRGDTPTRVASIRRLRHRVGRRGVLVTCLLVGTVVGVMGIFLQNRHAGRERVVSDTQVPAQDLQSKIDASTTAPVAADDVALLRDALDEWIEATRRGDIPTQMRFYPARVPVYYTWRDAPREAVRGEKLKVFGAARRLVITTDAPSIELTEDRLSATTRFRKRYVIEGPAVSRRGEVVQEMRWTRTPDGWVIVGERDARVLSAS